MYLEIRQFSSSGYRALCFGSSLLVGIGISAAILLASGVPARDLMQDFVIDGLLDTQSLAAMLSIASPLILVGLSAAVAFRVRFWNLGIEGQMIWGAITATAISLWDVGPHGQARLFLMALASGLAGALWIGVALAIRTRWRVNEIIATLMMNYIASNYLMHLLFGDWRNPNDGMPHTLEFRAFERLPTLFHGVTVALPIALALTALAAWAMTWSRFGFYMKVMHENEHVARLTGISVRSVTASAVLISGAISGLAGMVVCASTEGRLTQEFYQGYGFSGILIAFLAKSQPIAAAVVALFIALLFVGMQSLQIFNRVPFATVQLAQAIIVMSVAGSEFFVRYRIRRTPG